MDRVVYTFSVLYIVKINFLFQIHFKGKIVRNLCLACYRKGEVGKNSRIHFKGKILRILYLQYVQYHKSPFSLNPKVPARFVTV